MAHYRIEPLQSLQFGDGRAPGEGGAIRTLLAPPATTILGALRTALAASAGRLGSLVDGSDDPVDGVIGGRRDPGSLRLKGPLAIDSVGPQARFWVPSPADAEYLPAGETGVLASALMPVRLQAGDGLLDLQQGRPRCVPCALPANPETKPLAPPVAVPWSWMAGWLAGPAEASIPVAQGFQSDRQAGAGPVALAERVVRQHVVMTSGRTAEDGGLFQTEMVELDEARLAAWWIGVEGLGDRRLPSLVTLGGQQSLARLQVLDGPPAWAEPGRVPADIEKAIQGSGGYLRVVLLTPALFAGGHLPADAFGGEVRAAFVPRQLPVSGSRLLKWGRAEPRSAQRAAAAGSVYVVRYGSPQEAVEAAHRLWFSNVSDLPGDDRAAHLGLAVVGGYRYGQQMDEAWKALA